ncbi:hypothetical protein PVAP13_4KG123400 [Panicum virgatum]|uniref:Morc S5 domain-containing protein n=1 Tax=Panicum virgatum TaxID=38727 RepID=A0A8T0TKZ7_PANVG|nr:hypothetical protein PVAP13_4KG123400 [Panicum virgatum]
MIVDFVDLSSDDDDDAREEHSVIGKGHSVHVKADFVDLTRDEDIFEGEHLAYGQGDAARVTSFLKQQFFADDVQAEAAQCTVTLQTQELIADDGQGDAAQCTATLQMQEHTEDDGQGDASQSIAILKMQELRADHEQGDAVQYTAALQLQELRTDDERGDAAHCATTLQRQELTAEVGHGDATQCIATLQMQKQLIADDVQGDASQCATLQMQELTAGVGQSDAAQCTATVLMQELGADGHGDATQRTTILQSQELTADDGQGDTAQFTPTLQRQELTADDEQGDAVPCTSTLQRQQLNADDGQDDVAVCTTTLPWQKCISDGTQDDVDCCTTALLRQKSISDGAQGDVACCATALQRQEPDTAHGKGNAAQPTTLHRQEFPVVGDSMQKTLQFRNSEDATTSLSRTQEGSHRVTEFLNTSQAPTEEPFPRQFWKAGEDRLATQAAINNGQNRLRIHPKFLHSNATSHKWAFAIAELLDNAIDEMNNGATFVKIDKKKHSPNGDYSLVIEDNGGGMSPESLRHCMSFGFSQKCTTSSIGRYGNGFKTSTMRLGADAIVFTCAKDHRRLTRSIGLLSYTFLMSTRCNDIFVPAVDYEFDASSSTFKRIMTCGEKHFSSNLSTLLRWSPFSTEGELLNQFSDMGCHGTKIIVFNLWLNDALEMELDFMTDDQDIIISGAPELRAGHNKLEQMHVANRLRYSLRVYASILYLHVPESFQIILCGRAVEPHCAVNDLIYRECIKYQPQVDVTTEVDVITTIGYLNGAPQLDIYGFNVYHKNRLILPYWRAGSYNAKRRGIAGVLEADFIRPTHDKQDFERTGLFQRLETRLKDMATEYWTYHCHLVGYTQIAKKPPPAHYISTTADNDDHNLVSQAATNTCKYNSRTRASVALHPCSSGYSMQYPLHVGLDALTDQMDYACPSTSINVGTTSYISQNAPQQSQTELRKRRKSCSEIFWRAQKRRNTNVYSDEPGSDNGTEEAEEGFRVVLDQNTMLKAQCSELKAAGKQLTSKAEKLRKELAVWRRVYKNLTDELHLYNVLQGFRHGGHDSNPGIGFI